MSGRPPAEKSLERWRAVWRLHKQGYGQRQIARAMKLHLRSVQHYLEKGEPPKPPRMVLTRRVDIRAEARAAAARKRANELAAEAAAAMKTAGEAAAEAALARREADELSTCKGKRTVTSSSPARSAEGSGRPRPRVAEVIDMRTRQRRSS